MEARFPLHPHREEFILACEKALLETPQEQAERIKVAGNILSSGSWESTAEKMHSLLSTLTP